MRPTQGGRNDRQRSSADRIIRLVIGIAALVGAFALGFSSVGGIVLAVVGVGVVMLVSAMTRGYERRIATPKVPLRCWDARPRLPRRGVAHEYCDGRREAPRLMPDLSASLVSVRDAMAGGWEDPDTVVPEALTERIRGLKV